jgi:hypothetical protein
MICDFFPIMYSFVNEVVMSDVYCSIHCTRHVEQQFPYPLCLKVLQSFKVPMIFKTQFLRLVNNLHVERYGSIGLFV